MTDDRNIRHNRASTDTTQQPNYAISTSELVEELRLGLCRIPANGVAYPSDTDYTTFVRNTLAEMASKRWVHAYPNQTNGNREYLWDVSWWVETESLLKLVLAVESEWGRRGQVKYDFEKLLVAKSLLKLLITDSKGKLAKRKGEIEGWLRRYADHVKDELYIWISVKGSLNGGELRVFEYKAEASGPSKTAELKEISASPFCYLFTDVI